MADYETRETIAAQSRVTLARVVALGVAQSAWTVIKAPGDAVATFYTIADAEGLHFTLSGGSWNRESKIGASVAGIDADSIRVYPSDVRAGVAAPDANVSFERPDAAILKDILRRVVQHPDGIAVARAVRQTWEERNQQRARLRAHVAALCKLGASFRLDERTYWSAEGWLSSEGVHKLQVSADGSVQFDASCSLDTFTKFVAMLKKENTR
jgi:hypothetical protein